MALEKDYEVLCTLGEGAFGKVYKARHRATGDEVAAKEIKVGSKSFNEACNSMELKALKALRHPCIVRLRELLRSQRDGSLFFVFEFLDSDLRRLIKEHPQGLPEETGAIELMRQLLVGLAHIHQHGFFHRDVKPENILFDPARQTIRIADFGEARSLRARPPFTDYVGTRWYRAPECLLRDCNYSSPVDLWAAGLVFAELLRGSPVFMGTSSVDQLHKIFAVLGLPQLADWPEFQRLSEGIRFRLPEQGPCGWRRVLPGASSKVQTAVAEILIPNPRKRRPAKKCLEKIAIFAKLPPLDLQRLDSNRLNTPESSRVEDDESPLAESTDRPDVEITPPPSAARLPGMGIVGVAPAVPVDVGQDLDIDAELDKILAESPRKASTRAPGMWTTSNNINHASITGLLGSFSFAPSSRAPSNGTLPKMGQADAMHTLLRSQSPSPDFAPASPSGGMDALLASLEADLPCNHARA
mmetsp:Transcript_120090/g.339799  ORF Transcript_120090/g.339799 Transcript_120090/m.339799 type:complete len:470 (-) Transcript_120090:170-1579(-)|eukprot:CAMPEP_0117504634 /NCGR_PEP_ID=MMETSP0784-20121206/24950_1 /TAXON_ID=39447 /ORGANISM="" /LENGTH=469 /DNA_ID=CAMNT_0005299995 /DNA_START=66 /DNA_END=1475 /DNA_ORIENTATION=-